ncbi:MAG: histidine kinase [Gammaproteobacteria bacterium]|nr:MAG: histidine kinase [Gammaproteobacteria bacterium]RKZ45056.1 MAG: histidine kinase [Gammaproteobacteria bacterium]
MNQNSLPQVDFKTISFFRSLRFKLILLFLTVSLIPLVIVGGLSYIQAHNALETEVINKLIAVRDIKAEQITKFFDERLTDVKVFSQNPFVIDAVNAYEEAVHAEMKRLNQDDETAVMAMNRSLAQGDKVDDNSAYSIAHEKYHPLFKSYLEIYGYDDIFVVGPHEGIILYSVIKENDFGTSLEKGRYADSNLGHIFRKTTAATASDVTLLEDFAYYEPSKGAVSFIASPIFDQEQMIGVLIFQLPLDQIDAIMQESAGLGKTGETILVSSDDFLMRSNSRLFEEATIFKQKIDTEATRASAAGQTGVKEIIDYRGELAFIAHTPINISGVKWSLNAKMDESEATAVAQQMLYWMSIIIGIIAMIILGVAFLVSNSIAKPVKLMTDIAGKLAQGHIKQNIEIKSQDEIGVMGNAFLQMIINLRIVIEDTVYVSQGLADGKLNIVPEADYQGDFVQIKDALHKALSNQRLVVEDIVSVSRALADGNLGIKPQADYHGDFLRIKDALEMTLTDLRQVIEDIVQFAQGLAEGKQDIIAHAEYRGDFLKIKNALESAGVKLATTTKQNATQDWLKSGQNQLNDQMSGEQNTVELTHNVVSFLTLYLEAQVGVCYLIDEGTNNQENRLKMTASYAHTRRKNIGDEFEFSKGLVDRAARELKSIVITINSELGEAVPRHIIVVPFLYENTLKGVILLASTKPLTEIQHDFFHQIMPSIGVAVNAVESRSKMEALLEQTQIQAEELQNQQEELQSTNEELKSQQEELQTQAEELQTQTEELRQTNEELEERTQDLECQKQEIREKNSSLEKTRQVVEAKAQELELASKYKSEFLANMSHELRTPLNSMLILAQLLTENKRGNLNEKQVEYAQTIHSAGSDLLTLINEILDLSKVEAGKIDAHIDDVDAADLLETIESKFRHVANDNGLAFPVTIANNLPPVWRTDAQRLKQIINNLLSNAFKFTSEGEVKLSVQRPSDDLSSLGLDSTKIIAISVMDSGIGIPKDKLQVIFEAFQQADGTTSRRFGGTGLGLSISRQLARLLGGELQLHSEEGKGSTFTLYLPENLDQKTPKVAVQDQLPVVQPTPSKMATPPKVEEPIKDDRDSITPDSQSLLIVEDDRNFSHLVMELAQEKGFKCIIAEDGKTGLEFAEQYQPHAIILDLGLPKVDGWTVMEKLKDNAQTRHIPVHFMSGSDQSMEAKKMGAIGYLLKPVSMEQLGGAFQKIEQFISKKTKSLLVFVDDKQHQQNILDMVGSEDIQTTIVRSQIEALEHLKTSPVDCIILDVEVEKASGMQLLEVLHDEDRLSQIPVILHAERELSLSEETLLQKCADHLTIKTVKSPERLLDETTLFLHQLEAKLSDDKRQMLHKLHHDKEAILQGKTVLIVDDDVRNVFALATVLEDKDMEVVVAKDGEKALELLGEHEEIAIVLMDIMMPGMDGYEAMRKIRIQPRYRKLPIIALTAKAMKGDKAKCIEAGANDYLSKPMDTHKLLSLMRVWLYH